jgi:hypothetical protein
VKKSFSEFFDSGRSESPTRSRTPPRDESPSRKLGMKPGRGKAKMSTRQRPSTADVFSSKLNRFSKLPGTLLEEMIENIDEDWGNPMRMEGVPDEDLLAIIYNGTGSKPKDKIEIKSKSRQYEVMRREYTRRSHP